MAPPVPHMCVGRTAVVPLCCVGILLGLAAGAQFGLELYGTQRRQQPGESLIPAVAAVATVATEVAEQAQASAAGEGKSTGLVVVPPFEKYMYDIALSTGYRPQYGATFASCLVGLMASGAMLHAGALHVLLSDARLLNFSLVHNLAHMGSHVRVSLYDMAGASTSMRARNTFYQLLRAPDLSAGGSHVTPATAVNRQGLAKASTRQPQAAVGGGGGSGSDVSDLPAVFLEDDVWPVDDFARKMHAVALHAAKRTTGAPFIIKLYLHSGTYGRPEAVRAMHAESCNATATTFPVPVKTGDAADASAAAGAPGAVLVTAGPSRPSGGDGGGDGSGDGGGGEDDPSMSGYRAKPRMYKWGGQGLYFSDGAIRRRLADCYLKYTAKSYQRQNRYKDWPLKMCLAELGVATFDSGRSLVQHIGASSSLFGGAQENPRYHRACSFPFVERLPSEDPPHDWF